jgi:DNA-binding NtrC family response regulator
MLNPKKVMIVDDEPDIVTSIELALKRSGYRGEGFTDPEEAVKEFRNNSKEYALVISDIRMPGMSGFDLARNIKKTRPDIPLVIMTAFQIHKREFSSIFPSIPVSELVTKPVTDAVLFSIIRKYVGITKQH